MIKLRRQAKTIRFFFFFFYTPDRSFSKHVFEVPMSYCVSLERTSGGQTNACPLDCKNEPEVPTCGSDGSIYRNECEMQMLNCGLVWPILIKYYIILWTVYNLSYLIFCVSFLRQARRKVTVVDFEKCKNRLTKCTKQQQRCGNDVDPVCGSDANTYPNQCHLNVAVCL